MSQLSIQKTPGADPVGGTGSGFWSYAVDLELPSRSGSIRLHRDPRSLVRPRLVSTLHGRWRHRVTVLIGGPGFGKTALLVNALAEHQLAPQGEDVWVGIEPQDADGDSLGRAVATALGRTGDDEATDPAAVADLVRRRSPDEVCLVFDDVHLLPSGSAGAAWLAGFIGTLPPNGHVVMAGRVEPPVPLARLRAQGTVLRLAHDDLLFSEGELAAFAAERGVEPDRLAGTHGWPALAELTTSAEAGAVDAFLWEEVLDPLGPERRHVLSVVCDLGGADDPLASAALGAPVDLSRALAGVPLVSVGADGWRVPHALWHRAPGIALNDAQRAEVRRGAVMHLVERGRVDDAFSLLEEASLWDLAPEVLRAACLASDQVGVDRLSRWLSRCPPDVRTSPVGSLAAGLVSAAAAAPEDAIGLVRGAAARSRETGDVDVELAAIAQLGRLAWFRRDPTLYGEDLGPRLAELAAAGHSRARGLAAFCRATVADLAGDDEQVLVELSGIETGALDPSWEVMATWLCGIVRLAQGDADAVCDLVERLTPTDDPVLRAVLHALRLRAWWEQGLVEDVLDESPALVTAVRAIGLASASHLASTSASVMFSYVGDLAAAQRHLDDALAVAPRAPGRGYLSIWTALAQAAVHLAGGHEDRAAASLREVLDARGFDQGIDRRGWRHSLSLSYVLVPETRGPWDGTVLHGHLRTARDLAAAVVAVREGHGGQHLATMKVPPTGIVRTALPHRFVVDLAVGLSAVGRSEGAALLDAVGPAGRAVLRSAAAGKTGLAKPAKALLAAVPAPPPHPVYLATLGPLELRRDGPQGDEITNTYLRRKRVREMLAFLVGHRTATRAAITTALWPGLDERTSGNNLGVTLNYLLRALEPWRPPGEPTYLVRLDGQRVKLLTGRHLHVDVDAFDDHVTAAAQAEAAGTPSLALEHHLAAVALHRGALFSDLPDSSWIMLDREHYSSRFVHAATRAGQLLLGHRDPEQAETLARRAIDVDPSAELAHAVLVSAALAREDVSAARRQLQHCLTTLADLGIEPSAATREIHDRLHGTPPPR